MPSGTVADRATVSAEFVHTLLSSVRSFKPQTAANKMTGKEEVKWSRPSSSSQRRFSFR